MKLQNHVCIFIIIQLHEVEYNECANQEQI